MKAENVTILRKNNKVYNVANLKTRNDIWAIVETEVEVCKKEVFGLIFVFRMLEEETLKECILILNTMTM